MYIKRPGRRAGWRGSGQQKGYAQQLGLLCIGSINLRNNNNNNNKYGDGERKPGSLIEAKSEPGLPMGQPGGEMPPAQPK